VILADSNILIYAAKGSYPGLAKFLVETEPAFSAISYVETLGFHAIDPAEKRYIERFFRGSQLVPLDDMVLREAVRLHQIRKMTLGDALIAGTALVHGWTLATRNVSDFAWISGLKVVDPLSSN
jgi:toxin FitB